MTDKKISISRIFVITGLLISGLLIFWTMRMFLDGFLGAIILYMLFRNRMSYLIEKRKWKKGAAAMAILTITFFIVLIPLFVLINLIVPKISLLFSSGSVTMESLQKLDMKIHELTGMNMLTPDNINKIQANIGTFITDFLGQSFNILTDLALMYIFLYYLLINIGKVEDLISSLIPLDKERLGSFHKELEDQTRSNALGIPLLAIAQGLFAALGYWIFKLPDPFFWGIMTGFFSILPMIGSALIWVPAGIYMLTAGETWQGVGIVLYGIFVIGLVDNVFRLFFQKLFANIHPLVTIVGVIVGLQLFGMPGLIFGPLLISYFILFFRIFREDSHLLR